MRFRKIAEEMTDEEIEQVLEIVDKYAKLKYADRKKNTDFIMVYYTLTNEEEEKMYRIDLMADHLYIVGEDDSLDGVPIKDINKLWAYRQFTVAKGYSELWRDNIYAGRY